MKSFCSKSLLIAGALLLSASAVAQDKGMMNEPQVKKSMAMEHHERVPMTEAEHDAHAQRRFEKMDADHDGFVIAAELDQSRMAMKKDSTKMKHERTSMDVIKDMDSNKDGKLSAAEYRAGMKKVFDKFDTDKNSTLSVAEQEAARQLMTMQHN